MTYRTNYTVAYRLSEKNVVLKLCIVFLSRWEAEQIPKVKVAKLDRGKLNKEQSAYMPQIPDIAKCPEHLLPLKQWEDVFLAEFSTLRTVCSSRIAWL